MVAPDDVDQQAAATTRRLVQAWLDRAVVDVAGVPIGVVVAVYPDSSGADAWLGIDVGGFDALDIVIAPTAGARLEDGTVVVAFEHDLVVSTPRTALAAIAAAVTPVPRRRAGHLRRAATACTRTHVRPDHRFR